MGSHGKNILLLIYFLILPMEISCTIFVDNSSRDLIFIQNFFKNKNVTMTINHCWKNSKIKVFLKENIMDQAPKQIAIHRNISIETMDNFFHDQSTNNWFIMDFLNCKNYKLFEAMDDKKLFRYPLKHLILIGNNDYHDLLKLLETFAILPMSEILLACFEDRIINLYQPYKVAIGGHMIIEHYGNWSLENGLNSFYNDIPSARRRKNFDKSPLVVSAVVNNVESTLVQDFDDIPKSSANEPYFFQDIPNINNLVQYLNATLIFRTFDSYGYLNHTTGRFDGMVEDLYMENGHIAGTTLVVSEDRHSVVEFIKSYGYWSTYAKFILKKPSMSYIQNIYYMTFTNKVWIASAVVLVILGVTLYSLLNWEMGNLIRPNNKPISKKYTASDITLMSLEAVCQQGTAIDSTTCSGRTIIFILFTACMFLYVAYSAYILVLLQSTKPITSIRHLVDSRVECGGLNISFMMTYYKSTKDDALRDLYRKKIYPNRFFSLEDGLDKVQEGNFAFQVILGPAYNYILRKYKNYDICKLQELPGYMNTIMYTAVPKTSQFKKLFKVGLILAEERGLQHRIKNRVSMRPICYNEGGNFQSVRIYDCHSVFIMYAVGIILSFVVLLIEKITAK